MEEIKRANFHRQHDEAYEQRAAIWAQYATAGGIGLQPWAIAHGR